MNFEMLTLGISNVGLGLLCIALSLPLLRGKVPINRWYGVRIPKSMSSPENWRRINAYGARALIGWSIPVLLIGIGAMVAAFFGPKPGASDLCWFLPLSLSSLLLLGALVQTLAWSARLPRD